MSNTYFDNFSSYAASSNLIGQAAPNGGVYANIGTQALVQTVIKANVNGAGGQSPYSAGDNTFACCLNPVALGLNDGVQATIYWPGAMSVARELDIICRLNSSGDGYAVRLFQATGEMGVRYYNGSAITLLANSATPATPIAGPQTLLMSIFPHYTTWKGYLQNASGQFWNPVTSAFQAGKYAAIGGCHTVVQTGGYAGFMNSAVSTDTNVSCITSMSAGPGIMMLPGLWCQRIGDVSNVITLQTAEGGTGTKNYVLQRALASNPTALTTIGTYTTLEMEAGAVCFDSGLTATTAYIYTLTATDSATPTPLTMTATLDVTTLASQGYTPYTPGTAKYSSWQGNNGLFTDTSNATIPFRVAGGYYDSAIGQYVVFCQDFVTKSIYGYVTEDFINFTPPSGGQPLIAPGTYGGVTTAAVTFPFGFPHQTNGTYILIVAFAGPSHVGVFTASKPLGPYTFQSVIAIPGGGGVNLAWLLDSDGTVWMGGPQAGTYLQFNAGLTAFLNTTVTGYLAPTLSPTTSLNLGSAFRRDLGLCVLANAPSAQNVGWAQAPGVALLGSTPNGSFTAWPQPYFNNSGTHVTADTVIGGALFTTPTQALSTADGGGFAGFGFGGQIFALTGGEFFYGQAGSGTVSIVNGTTALTFGTSQTGLGGQTIAFQADTTHGVYTIATGGSGTAWNLTANYTGTTLSLNAAGWYTNPGTIVAGIDALDSDQSQFSSVVRMVTGQYVSVSTRNSANGDNTSTPIALPIGFDASGTISTTLPSLAWQFDTSGGSTWIPQAGYINLSGPSTGTVNTPSANFSVVLPFTMADTITLSDGGAGGTFSTGTTLSPTLNGATTLTFTYTSVTTSPVVITITPASAMPVTGNAATYTASGGATTTYSLTGPTSGQIGNLNTYTLTPSGTVASDNVTVTATGSAGVLSTNSLIFTSSSAPQSFTFRPTAAGTATLTLSSGDSYVISGSPLNINVSSTQYTLSGPSTGAANATLTYTLTPAGTVVSDTVSIAVAGVAGTLSTNSLHFTSSSAPQTFTFTPSATGTATITLTSTDGGSISGSPFTLTVVVVIGYTLAGPTALTVGVAATYTVTPAFTIGYDIVGIAESGPGGTLSNTSFIFRNNNWFQYFTFTPMAAGSTTLTITSGDGYTTANSPLTVTATAVNYTLAGPASGTVGTPVTLTLTPAAATIDTITPAVTGITGTFSPNPIRVNGSGPMTVAFTATSAGTATISATSLDGGTITPSLTITYTTVNYTFTGPSAVIEGFAARFTMTPNALTNDSVTFSDGGKGGTFTPPTRVFVNDANAHTVAYQAATTGSITITPTSADGATFTPGSITITASAGGGSGTLVSVGPGRGKIGD